MISWLQKVLQKHYKWLFSIMLIIIIIAFVFTIGGSPGIGHSQVSSKKQIFYGINLNNQEQVQKLFRNANISSILNTGQSITNKQMAENLALTRPPLLFLAKKLEIIHPNEFELTEYIKTRPLFKNAEGDFDPQKYKEFINQVKKDANLSEHLVREVLTEDEQMDKVSNLLGGPGYALPFESQFLSSRQKTIWSVDVASLDVQELSTNLNVSDEKLEEHYANNKLNFTTPPTVEIAYALFPTEKFLSQVPSPSDDELKEFQQTDFKDEEKDKTFEEIKPKILAAYKKNQAERLAAESANNLQIELHTNNVPYNSEEFKNLLKKYNLTLTHIPPFPVKSTPKGTPVPQQLLREASKLNINNYYSDVATSDKGAFMLFFKAEHPPTVPPFEEIKKDLMDHFVAQESHKLLESKAKILDKTLASAVKADKSFKKVAKEEGLKVTSFDKFKLLEAPSGLDKTIIPDIQKLSKGAVSSPIIRDDRIYFVYVRDKEIPTPSESDSDSQALFKQLDVFTSMARSYSITNELIAKGLADSEK